MEQAKALVKQFCIALNLPVGYRYTLAYQETDKSISLSVSDKYQPLTCYLIDEDSVRVVLDSSDNEDYLTQDYTSLLELFSILAIDLWRYFGYQGFGPYFSHLVGRRIFTWRDLLSSLGYLSGIDFVGSGSGLATEGFSVDVREGYLIVRSFFSIEEKYEDTIELVAMLLTSYGYWLAGEGLDLVYPEENEIEGEGNSSSEDTTEDIGLGDDTDFGDFF